MPPTVFATNLIDVLLAGCAEALNALAGFLKQGFRGRIGNAEVRAETESRTVNDGDAFGLEQLGHEVLVRLDDLARRRGLADQALAGRIDVERTFRRRALDTLGLVQHRDDQIAATFED